MPYQFKTTEERSALMKKIKSAETKPEVQLRKALWSSGIRYRKNYSILPGKPDIAIIHAKVAIFIDGEFWHGYNWDEKRERIKANSDYWIPKIERTIARDEANNNAIKQSGWTVLRFWEHQIKSDLTNCVVAVQKAVFAEGTAGREGVSVYRHKSWR